MSSHNRRTTRASGRAHLSGSMQDVIRDAKTAAMYEKRAFREQKYESERIPKFHSFMKLSPELRLHIYFLAMEDADSPRHLVTLRAPTLALVSKQVQEEAMPVFLSRCAFYLNIESNYKDVVRLDRKAADGTLEPLSPGSPRLCCVEATALQRGQRRAVFPTRGNAHHAYQVLREHHNHQGPIQILSLHAYGGRLLLDYKSLENTDLQPGLDQFRKDAETVARDIAARHKKHRGFCYEELDAIAKSFRYWPPGAPEFR